MLDLDKRKDLSFLHRFEKKDDGSRFYKFSLHFRLLEINILAMESFSIDPVVVDRLSYYNI